MSWEAFWSIYPRKVSKMMVQKAWLKLSTIEQAQALEALPVHIKYWKATDTEPQYIPHATTWLNQHRFEDEIDMPVPNVEPAVAWWSNEQLILAKGREMGLLPRPGEDIWSYKARLSANLKAA